MCLNGHSTDIVRGYLVRSAKYPDFFEMVIELDRPGILEAISSGIQKIRAERRKQGKCYEKIGEVFGIRKQLRIIVRKLNADFMTREKAA